MKCPTCEQPVKWTGGEGQTMVGYPRGDCGRVHDDNCQKRSYVCPNGHITRLSKRRSCKCGWQGKETCFCHTGVKVAQWPNVRRLQPANPLLGV